MRISKKTVLSLAAGVVLLLQILGIRVNLPYVNEVVEAACGMLIVFGLVAPERGENTEELDSSDSSEAVDSADSVSISDTTED